MSIHFPQKTIAATFPAAAYGRASRAHPSAYFYSRFVLRNFFFIPNCYVWNQSLLSSDRHVLTERQERGKKLEEAK
jgi:hypothetical protein